MSVVDTIRAEICVLHEKIRIIQAECSHPQLCVTRVARADTGNWCADDDSYWYECSCSLCQKTWTEPQ